MTLSPHSLARNTRQVRHLQVRLADRSDTHRARIALEDGLAAADFGDYGRLILVRRLSLGRLPDGINGPGAARAIERSFRALSRHAVHGSEPAAAEASVVWFVDRVEALLEALSLRVENRALDAWYWRKVEPAIFATTPAIAALFDTLIAIEHVLPASGVAVRALAKRWRSWTSSAFMRFIAALPEDRLVAVAPVTSEGSRTPIVDREERENMPSLLQHARARIATAARVSVPKGKWVAALELAAAEVSVADLPRALQLSPASSVVEHVLRNELEATVIAPAALLTKNSQSRVAERELVVPTKEPDVVRATLEALRPVNAAPRRQRPVNVPIAPPPWLGNGYESAHAGFFMLLNVWRAMGFYKWVDAQTRELQPRMIRAWLDCWSRRLHMPDDDVQRAVWSSLPADESNDDSPALNFWMRRTRRWLRTQARIGPASLVGRAGLVLVTRTHLDVVFPLSEVDLRIRRRGLDQDPGWVGWLGRIVAFHYLEAPGSTA